MRPPQTHRKAAHAPPHAPPPRSQPPSDPLLSQKLAKSPRPASRASPCPPAPGAPASGGGAGGANDGFGRFLAIRRGAAQAKRRGDRLSRHLDLVTLEAPPRVELTSARGGNPTADELRPSPSSTPPSTRPRLLTESILAAAARQFHLPASLLLLAKQN